MPDQVDVPSPTADLPVFQPSSEQRTIGFRARYRVRRLRADALLDAVRSTIETQQDKAELRRLRGGREVVWTDDPQPLVTVRIATYSARERLAVAIESALRQTYPNVEVLVVGDHCDDETAQVAQSYRDRGVRFFNLPRRGQYPDAHDKRWMVAGAAPMNTALELARGAWIAPCDDDDMVTDDHVEKLLTHARHQRLEFVWSRAALQAVDGSWVRTAADRFEEGHISHGAVLYCSDLRFMRYNRRAYLSRRPGDWELWLRMRRAGVRMGYLDELTYYHFA
jgi:glycosyltransferase involved in cell wall biosynthesis